jgi:hypothetical protein
MEGTDAVLFACAIVELSVSAILVAVGFGLILAHDLSTFDKSMVIHLGAILAITILVMLAIIAFRNYSKQHLVTGVLLLLFDIAVLGSGIFELTNFAFDFNMKAIETGWADSNFADAVQDFEDSNFCCGIIDEEHPDCDSFLNQSCYGVWARGVRAVCDAIGSGLIGIAGLNLPRVVLAFMYWRHNDRIGSLTVENAVHGDPDEELNADDVKVVAEEL